MIKQIRAAKQNAKIIVLSSQENIEIALAAVKNKGCSYVKKGPDDYEKVHSIIQNTVNKKVKARTILKNNAQNMEQQVINGETCL